MPKDTPMKLFPYLAFLVLGSAAPMAQEKRSNELAMIVTFDLKSRATGALLKRDERRRTYSSLEMCEHIAKEEQAVAQEHLDDNDSEIEVTCRPAK